MHITGGKVNIFKIMQKRLGHAQRKCYYTKEHLCHSFVLSSSPANRLLNALSLSYIHTYGTYLLQEFLTCSVRRRSKYRLPSAEWKTICFTRDGFESRLDSWNVSFESSCLTRWICEFELCSSRVFSLFTFVLTNQKLPNWQEDWNIFKKQAPDWLKIESARVQLYKICS